MPTRKKLCARAVPSVAAYKVPFHLAPADLGEEIAVVDLQQLDIFRLGPIAETRLGLALAASTKLLCVQAMTDLRTTHGTSVGARPQA